MKTLKLPLMFVLSVSLSGVWGCSQQDAERVERVSARAWSHIRRDAEQVAAELGLTDRSWEESLERLYLVRWTRERVDKTGRNGP
jgi:hypothetical protein